ncbi:hypothetical protein H0H93_004282 [Arthromyces matolae]|nr:hypothetical protein H0H93_004282 [Arthromyces matolae]
MRFKSHFLTSIYIVTYLLSLISPTSSTPIPHKDVTSGDVTILASLPRRSSTEMVLDGVETGQVPNSIPQADSSTVNHDSVVVPLGEPLDARGRAMKLYTVPFGIAALPGFPMSIRIPADDTQVDEQDVEAMNKFISEILKRLDAQPSTTSSPARQRLSKWIFDLKRFRNFKNLSCIQDHNVSKWRSNFSHQTDGVEPPPTLGEPLQAQGRTMVKRNLPPRLCGWQGIPKSINTPLDLTTINAEDLKNMGRFIDEILHRLNELAGANDPTLNIRRAARDIFFTWGQHSKSDPGCPQNPPPHDSASSMLHPTIDAGYIQNPVAQPHNQSNARQTSPRVPSFPSLQPQPPGPKRTIYHPGEPDSQVPGNMPQGGTRDAQAHSPG